MRLYGLIGYPLGHSFSKQYFTEKFEREGLTDCRFEAFPIATIHEFPALVKSQPDLVGMGVTIPYKEQVLQFIDETSPEVRSIGATNSIKFSDGKLTAYNTDTEGFEGSFRQHLQPHHRKALILGTGGASKAVQYVLAKMGIEFLVVSRQKVHQPGYTGYAEIGQEIMEQCTVIINCSPVGMYPNEDTAPALPYHLLTPQHYLYDLVYKPVKTLFLQKGEERGAIIQNGYDMLVIQAEASWKIWNDL